MNRRSIDRAAKQTRCLQANILLTVIGCCGRRFFRHGNKVSRMEIDDRGRIFFVDAYKGRRIYTHHNGRWLGFSEGGTLRSLIERLRDYITGSTPLRPATFGPWPDHICAGDLWGYGADMERVRAKATELGITKQSEAAGGAA